MKKLEREEEDVFNVLEEERQHWSEVERTHERIEESKCWVMASKMEEEDSWVSSQASLQMAAL